MKKTNGFCNRYTSESCLSSDPDAVAVNFYSAKSGEGHPDVAIWDDDEQAFVWCETD